MKMNLAAPQVSADRGCLYAPKCVSCPYQKCIEELAPTRRAEFADAWRVVLAHMAAPDSAIPV